THRALPPFPTRRSSDLDDILDRRRRVAEWYRDELQTVDEVRLPEAVDGAAPAWFVEFLRVTDGIDRDALVEHLNTNGIESKAYRSEEHTSELQSRFELV